MAAFDKLMLVKMVNKNVSSFSFQGEEVPVDEGGVVEVPAALVEDFKSHGFKLVEDSVPAKKK